MKAVRIAIYVILILLLIIAFQNLSAPVGIQLLFWKINTSVLWTIVISFLLGLIAGISLFWSVSRPRASREEAPPSTEGTTQQS